MSPDHASPAADPFAGFHPVSAAWFTGRYGPPSPPQRLGWPRIGAGQHVLITAPTGSGKTLAAFYKCLDALWQDRLAGLEPAGVELLYVSPLKALNADIERNLREPLAGVAELARAQGLDWPELRVGLRTGDTDPAERQRMVRRPPQILITTPESLYLILTSERAREMLRTVRFVIVDEMHALLGSKRGAHLTLSLERLEQLTARPPVRIGLSATVRPLEQAARFLGGQDPDGRPRPVAVCDAGMRKELDLRVEVPVEEVGHLPDDSIWPSLHQRLLELIRSHRSTLVFVNFRRGAERLAARLNELAGCEIAQTHHGSLSREHRRLVEERLKAGDLPCLVATSSLELGIDVGAIDLVVQVESPKGVAAGLQRVGRAGHLLGAASKGRILPKYRTDLLEAAAVARAMQAGRVETARVAENCLDVLAQQVAAMAAVDEWPVDRLHAVLKQAYPYRRLTRRQLEGVLAMLAGRYASETFADLRPRLTWDSVNGLVRARPGLRMLAVRSGGTIPDRGNYAVTLQGSGVKLGEVDEEFAFESRPGEAFVLGSSTWRIVGMDEQRLEVVPAPGAPAKMPFWKGDAPGRPYELGRAVGQLAREVAARLGDPELLEWLQAECALDGRAAANLRAWIWDQQELLGAAPSDQTIVAEWFRDSVGALRLMLHSPFGLPVHAAWGLALKRRLQAVLGTEVQLSLGDDGILFRLPPLEGPPPLHLISELGPDEAEELLLQELGHSAAFGAHFRMAAELALLLPRRGRDRRTPLWLQRMKAKDLLEAVRAHPDFPVLLEAYRDVLQSRVNLDGLREVLSQLRTGAISLHPVETPTPSPAAAGLLFSFAMEFLYEGDTPRAERAATALGLERGALLELLGSRDGLRRLLDRSVMVQVEDELQRRAPGRRARSRDELHDLLLRLGDLTAGEAAERCEPLSEAAERCEPLFEAAEGAGETDAARWLEELAAAGRAVTITIAGERRWVAAEEQALYAAAGAGDPAACDRLLRRWVRHRGPFTLQQAAARYGWEPQWVRDRLAVLEAEGRAAAGGFTPGESDTEWCDLEVLERIRRRTLAAMRREAEPAAPGDYARFLWHWQGCEQPAAPAGGGLPLRRVLRQLQGLWLPAALWEQEILPRRLSGYQPAWLDQLLASGEAQWVGQNGKVAFLFADNPWALPGAVVPEDQLTPAARRLLGALRQRGASFLGPLAMQAGLTPAEALPGLWELVWAGLVSNDTFAPLREHLRQGKGRPARADAGGRLSARGRRGAERAIAAAVAGGTGRWSLLPWAYGDLPAPDTAGWAERLLQRWGVVGREMAAAEAGAPPWSELLPVFRQWEFQGRVRQGYFVGGLSGQQFALPQAVERLRALRAGATARAAGGAAAGDAEAAADRLSGCAAVAKSEFRLVPATDPANPYGPVLPPPSPADGRWRLTRAPGSYLVLRAGIPVLAVEGYGRRLVPLAPLAGEELQAALSCLRELLRPGGRERPVRRIELEWWADRPAAEAPVAAELEAAGFERSYRRMVLWPGRG